MELLFRIFELDFLRAIFSHFFLLSKSAERQRRFRAREQSMKPKKKTTKDSEIQTETVEEDESDDRPLSAAKMAANDART